MPSTRLGPYEIGVPLGKGGMGCVYRAVNVDTGDKVAVKVLSPQLAMAEGFRGRFEAEIDSLKTLRHEGIVRLYGWGEEQGTLFYSMELVEGTSLEEELKAGRRFNWREVVNIAIQICKALKHAHDRGVIHRDIKPANILIDDRERVKLADFGIARLFGGTQLTSAGGVLGTADYMSPEQADGRPVTARCDQYSLGGVMYALLAGRPPFRARSLPEMLQLQRFAEPEPVRRYAPQTPEQLEQAIQQLLSKDPVNRFPNVMVLARHLEAMTIALSRPTQDDFDLAEEQDPRTPVSSDPSQSLAVTQADPKQMTAAGVLPTRSATTPPSDNGDSVSMLLAASDHAKSKPASEAASEPIPRSRFTTVEEEEAQKHSMGRDSIWVLLAQWGGLLVVLAGLAAGIWYASRPPSADQLYSSVQSAIDNDDSLSSVSREIEQFLAQFPSDERIEEMSGYHRQLELERMGRSLRLNARRNRAGENSLLAVERLYLEAMDLAKTNPQRAAAKLQQVIALFDGASNDTDDPQEAERITDCLALAKQQLADLQLTSSKFAKSEISELRSRLDAARELALDDPDRAKEMAAAIVELYGDQAWAEPIVSDAKALLEETAHR